MGRRGGTNHGRCYYYYVFFRLFTNTATESYENEAALTPSTQKKTKAVTGFCKKTELEQQLVASGINHGRRYYYYGSFDFLSTLVTANYGPPSP